MIAITVLAAAALAQSPTEHPSADDPYVRTRLDMRVAETVLEAYRRDGGTLPAEDDWLSLETLAEKLGAPYARWLPAKDGWAHSLLYKLVDEEIALVSNGPDGLPTITSKANRWGDDVLFLNRQFLDSPTITTDFLKAWGVAMERYAEKHGTYPDQTDGLVPASTMEPLLVPRHIEALKTTDAWGHALLVYADRSSYVVVSLGSDGKADREYDPRKTGGLYKGVGERSAAGCDLLFINGSLVQWPAADGH